MSHSIKVLNNDDGKISIDGKKANAKTFSEYIKGPPKKPIIPAGYNIIIYHHGTPYTIDGNLIASRSEFVLGLTKLFKPPLQLDFSDCSQCAIEKVIHYLKTGDDDFDPLEISSVYDIIVKLDIRPLRMSLKRRIDNAIVSKSVERQLGPCRARSISRSRKQKRTIQDYKECFDEVYGLIKAISKFTTNLQGTDDAPKIGRGRSTKRSMSKRRKPSVCKSVASRKGKSKPGSRSKSRQSLKSKPIDNNCFSTPRSRSDVSRKSRSISKIPMKYGSKKDKPTSEERKVLINKKKNKFLRDLSQLSGNGRKNVPKEEVKKESKSRRRYKGKGKKLQQQQDPSLSPFRKETVNNGIITIAPYYNKGNVFAGNDEYFNDVQSSTPSSFTTDTSEDVTRNSLENNNQNVQQKHKGFKGVKRSEGFNTWLARKNKQPNSDAIKDFLNGEDIQGENKYF